MTNIKTKMDFCISRTVAKILLAMSLLVRYVGINSYVGIDSLLRICDILHA